MPSVSVSIPVFEQCSDLEAYENRVQAWAEVTNIAKNERAICLALAMNETSEEIFMNISLEELKADNGLEVLFSFLRERFGKHEVIDCLDTYDDFRLFKREKDQTMIEYCSQFEQKRKKIEARIFFSK